MAELDYKPMLRLNVYQNATGFYLETEKAVVIDRKVEFEAPVPFRNDHLKPLAEYIIQKEKEEEDSMIFPADLLARKKDFVVLFDPPMRRSLKFTKSLKVKNGKFLLPGIIYMFCGHSLSIFAYKGSLRPTSKTELFKAPFYNVYYSGSICMGNNKMQELHKLGSPYNAALAAKHMFFNSNFSHYSDTQKLNKMTLEELYRGKFDEFPTDNLISHGQTLQEEIISQIT